MLGFCEHQAGKIERLYVCLVQQKTLQALQGSAINKIPNIPQCTLPPRPVYQTLLSDFSRVWLQDYLWVAACFWPLLAPSVLLSHLSYTKTLILSLSLAPQDTEDARYCECSDAGRRFSQQGGGSDWSEDMSRGPRDRYIRT